MNCEICGTSPLKNSKVILTRVNEYGVKGIWRCELCLIPAQKAARDPETYKLCELIVEENKESGGQS